MSELELLVDCVKDAAKERDELAAALEQARADLAVVGDLKGTISSQLNRIEQLEAAFGRLLTQLANNTKVAVKMFDEIVEAKNVLETAGESGK